MWSRKGICDWQLHTPVPSRLMLTSTFVSLVSRLTVAERTASPRHTMPRLVRLLHGVLLATGMNILRVDVISKPATAPHLAWRPQPAPVQWPVGPPADSAGAELHACFEGPHYSSDRHANMLLKALQSPLSCGCGVQL